MIISIEGNIGSGKSTLLQILKDRNNSKENSNSNVYFVDEPVAEWDTIKADGKTILELFYQDQTKYSFTFQITAYITRLRKLLNALDENPDKIIICERSIYTDKYVFAKMLYQQGHIDEIQWQSYNYWFDTFKEKTKVDMIIYVNTEPETCYNRIKMRNRNGESNIPLDYLTHCHRLHQEWLKESPESASVINFDGNVELSRENSNDYIQSLSSINGLV